MKELGLENVPWKVLLTYIGYHFQILQVYMASHFYFTKAAITLQLLLI